MTDLAKNGDFPPWKLKESLLVLVLVFLINNFLALILGKLGLSKLPLLSYFTVTSLLQTALIILFVAYFVLIKYGQNWSVLGLHTVNWEKTLINGLGGGLGIFFTVVLAGALVESFYPLSAELQPFAKMVLKAESLSELSVLFIMGVILVPLGEEIYFRGFLYPSLRKHIGIVGAVIMSGMIFGLLHFDLLRFVPLALGGIGLAWLYEKAGSLYTSIAAHGVWNLIMLSLLVFNKGQIG